MKIIDWRWDPSRSNTYNTKNVGMTSCKDTFHRHIAADVLTLILLVEREEDVYLMSTEEAIDYVQTQSSLLPSSHRTEQEFSRMIIEVSIERALFSYIFNLAPIDTYPLYK